MRLKAEFEGVKATVQNYRLTILTVLITALFTMLLSGCNTGSGGPTATGDSGESAAAVNGKAIRLEEIERVLKQQAQGQETNLSPLELAQARLQILENLIQQEVMFQKAEKEGTVPTEEEVTAEFNKRKTGSGLSSEQFDAKMKESGETDASAREVIKKGLAIQKLVDKITGKIEPPKDKEIEDFYNGNKAAFVKKKGVKLGAIVIDPSNSGQGDTTTNEQEAVLRGNEIIKQLQQGVDFAAIASEKSEDQSRLQRGDLGYISEEEMRQSFPPQVIATLMDPKFQVGQILPTPMQGKFYIFKLQERSMADENLTLESPGIRQQVADSLINARKQLLSQSYAAIAMNEAKVENHLAKKVVENPNELSGARPASAATAATPAVPANTAAANTNANTGSTANTNAGANSRSANANAAR
ncbi:MAG: Peptidylprolyl isomerase [Acidobacteria bacterium]|jgi:parvulin-like peptidyl-prolyl isomerase|nr:Peptidylprolyl isomerase [Acidobacteriota bacterium]